MVYFVVFVYLSALAIVFLFSVGQMHLVWHFLKAQKQQKMRESAQERELQHYPYVTIQLPLYNEKYVVQRLIKAVAAIDYPPEKLQIQVLDDSTDETPELAAETIAQIRQRQPTLSIELVRRPERVGYKAGALAYGLAQASGEYIAIFDADFLPNPDFLHKTLPHFTSENIGMVQTRWGHLNRGYSWLTQAQAFGLDAHFTIEQTGRSHAGSFINFNGTAGVWRKTCIESAGGWQPDTLTEDLDLSYRAQLKGWKFVYLQQVESPAELPITMPAFKSQQFRWNKGAAETARKHLIQVLKHPQKWVHTLHACFHLLNSSVFLFLLIAALASVPLLWVKARHPELTLWFHLGGVFVVGFLGMMFFYWTSTQTLRTHTHIASFLKGFLLFLTVYMGLALHNAIAVAEGWIGIKTPFIRTPKFNVIRKSDGWRQNVYLKRKVSWATLLEGLLSVYFIVGVGIAFWIGDVGLLPFHTMLALGFGSVFYLSLNFQAGKYKHG